MTGETVFKKDKGIVFLDSNDEIIFGEHSVITTERLTQKKKTELATQIEEETGKRVAKMNVVTDWYRKGDIGNCFASGYKIDYYNRAGNIWNFSHSCNRTNK